MPNMTTTLVEHTNNGANRTWSLPTHTAVKPQLLIQKRRIPSGKMTSAETELRFVAATTDADGVTLVQKHSVSVTVTEAIQGQHADLEALVAIFRDVIDSDEFSSLVDTQGYLK